MKIENIRLFLEVVQLGSINKAAEKLYISQQSLSTIMKNMEAELGVELLVRNHKGIALTADGEKFLACAQTIVSAFDEFRLQSSLSGEGCVLNFYTTPSLSQHVAELQGIAFGGKYYLSVHERSSEELADMIEKKRQGIYFLALWDGKPENIAQRSDKYVIAADEQSVEFCHESSPLLTAGADGAKAAWPKIINTYRADDMVQTLNIGDIHVCKKLMREKGFCASTALSLFRMDFAEDEWTVLKVLDSERIEYVLFFRLGADSALREVKGELLKMMREKFTVS